MTPRVELPPGPRWLLPAVARWVRGPLEFLEEMAAQHGDVFSLPPALGTRLVVFAAPADIECILSTPSSVLCGASAAQAARWMFGDRSIFLMEGDAYRDAARVLARPFHGAPLRLEAEGTLHLVRDAVARWPVGKPLRAETQFQQVTTQAVVRVVAGRDPGPVPPGALEEALEAINQALGNALVFIPALQRDLGAWSPWRRVQRAREKLHGLLGCIVAHRRDHGAGDAQRLDLVDALMAAGVDGREMMDQLTSVLMAGQETSAKALAWALGQVLAHPQVLMRLQQDVDALGDAPPAAELLSLPWLEAVCLEALRLGSVVPFTPRMVLGEVEIGGCRLVPGMMVGVAIHLAHQRPDSFPNPRAFVPQRFLGANHPRNVFLPFGGGPRRCLGWQFALQSMKLVLASVVGGLEMRRDDQLPLRSALGGVTVAPRGGVPFHVLGRRGWMLRQ